MRKCNVCGRTWVSQSPVCISCGSKDIIWEINKEKQKEREE